MEHKILPSLTFYMACLTLIYALPSGQDFISEYSLQGVVGSQISLRCPAPAEANVEIVNWMIDTLDNNPFVTYVVKDKQYTKRLTGYEIINDTTLFISSLKWNESRTFFSKIVSGSTDEPISCVVVLKVLDGCALWNYTSPLQSSTTECSAGGHINYKTTCTFACENGFQLEGTRSTQCLANGEFSSALPQCEAIYCTVPNFPPNLRSTYTTCASGSTVEYFTDCSVYCDRGYQLVGNYTATCLANGQFDNPLPVCEVIHCTLSLFQSNILSTNSLCSDGSHIEYMTECTFHCDAGYQLLGDSTVTCVADGTFDRPLPSCKDQTVISPGVLVAVILTALLAIGLACVGYRVLIKKSEHRAREVSGFQHWVKCYITLFTEHLPTDSQNYKAALHKVLQKLNNNERQVIGNLPHSRSFEYRRILVQETETGTHHEALALYTAALISFDNDRNTVAELGNEIHYLLSNGNTPVSPEESSATQFPKKSKKIDKYLDIIHSALAGFIASYRKSLALDKRKKLSGKVASTIHQYFKFRPAAETKNNKRMAESEHGMGNYQMQSDALAGSCINTMNVFENIEDKINIRQKILQVILFDEDVGLVFS